MPKDMLLCVCGCSFKPFPMELSQASSWGAAEDLGISPEAFRTSFQLLPDNPLTLSWVAASEAFLLAFSLVYI